MKCPKCGYNSFESHDVCTKCANDLTGYKQTYGIAPIVFPLETRQQMAAEFLAANEMESQQPDEADSGEDMFSFDLPEDASAAPAAAANDDPFNFDDDPLENNSPFSGAAPQSAPEEDAFADLLESTSQAADDPFADISTAPAAPAAPPKQADSAPGEFDLENFSWDDTPVAAGAAPDQSTDDFDSLFGDPEEKK